MWLNPRTSPPGPLSHEEGGGARALLFAQFAQAGTATVKSL